MEAFVLFLSALLSMSRVADAACVLTGARPTVPLPTMMRGQEFSFLASQDCATLRFTIRGTTVSERPKPGGPTGPGPNTYKVLLTESEWNAVVAESGPTLTWVVTGRTSTGEMTRLVTTNDLDTRDGITIDLSMADAMLVGENPDDRAGYTASGAGDVNGDGNDDLFVSAFANSEGGVGAGAAYLVLGPVTGTLDLSLSHAKLVGEERGDHAGESSAGAGDVDRDGHDDLLVGSRSHDGGTGAAYLVLGPVSGTLDLSLADAKLLGESAGDGAGYSVSGAGDANGDGHDDVLVSGVHGVAYLLLGPLTGTFDLGLADAELALDPALDRTSHVASAGDVDGDGHDDLLIGSAFDIEAGTNAGAAYLVSGPVSGLVDLPLGHAKLLGETSSDLAGWSVSGAGDIDGDGNDDLLVGACFNDEGGPDAGAAYVVLGPVPGGTRDLAHVADAKLLGAAGELGAASMVAGAGDVDSDGHDDLLVGSSANSDAATAAGAAYLVLSPVAGTMQLGRADIQFTGENRSDHAGHGGDGAGDVDADGRADLLISALSNDEGGVDAGAAYLIYGGGL